MNKEQINLAEYQQQRQESAIQEAARALIREQGSFSEIARRYGVSFEEVVTAAGAIIERKRAALGAQRGG